MQRTLKFDLSEIMFSSDELNIDPTPHLFDPEESCSLTMELINKKLNPGKVFVNVDLRLQNFSLKMTR